MINDSNSTDQDSKADLVPPTDGLKWWQRISRRMVIGATLTCVAGFAILYEVVGGSHDSTTESVLPSSEERFADWIATLEKSETTEARNDDLTVDDKMLRKLTSLTRLTIIQVKADNITVDTFSALAAMPNLEQLHLRGAPVNDDMLDKISDSQTIWLLNLPAAVVSPEALERLAKMPALRQLRLGVQRGDNRHSRAVATLSKLRTVHLIGIAVTDEGLQPLARMPQLESLYLDDTAVTESGWTWLFQNNPHLHVHVNQKHHDRDPQKH